MKSISSVLFVILAVLVLASGFAAVAQADSIYTNWRTTSATDGVLYGYDMGTTTALPSFGPPSGTAPPQAFGYQPQGLAISPTNGNVYVGLYSKPTSTTYDLRIRSYNPVTGAFVSDVFSSTDSTQIIRPLAFDDAGNLYAGLGNKYIAKYTASTSTWDYTWGNPATNVFATGGFAFDLEVNGGYLYASVQGSTSTQGRVVRYALSGSGVNATLVTTDANLTRVSGLAFGPDGTMYTTVSDTSGSNPNTFGYWNSTFDTYTVLKSGLTRPVGIEYSDGFLYVNEGHNTQAKIDKYEIGTAGWTAGWINSPSSYWNESGFVAVAGTVPEPSTLALLACGLIGLLAYAWRKRK